MAPLDRHSSTGSNTSTSSSSSRGDNRLRDALRLLRCLERVEISGTSLNWDAQPCFVLLVSVRDTDARRQAYARGETRRSPAPFQIERTQAELAKLLRAMRHWCARPHGHDDNDTRCGFCGPVVTGALVAEAVRVAKDDKDVYAAIEDERDAAMAATPCCFGFLANLFGKRVLKPESDDEWEAWLNASIAHVRTAVDIKADPADTCDGARHVPTLLARFLLDNFVPEAAP